MLGVEDDYHAERSRKPKQHAEKKTFFLTMSCVTST